MQATASDLVSLVSRRGPVWLVIAAVHIALILAVTRWSPVRIALDAAPIEATIVDAPAVAADVPPPVDPKFDPVTTPTVDPPLVTITEEPPPNAITVTVAETPPPPAPAPAAPRIVTDVAYVEPPQPHYPAESRRSGEEGLVVLRVLINELGRADRVEVERSSGHVRLDEAACNAVRRARFRPYLENGVARMALATIPIEFSWKSRRADRGGRG
ncbi:MAG: TonB family protein [Gammaproteobacteria bacterium]